MVKCIFCNFDSKNNGSFVKGFKYWTLLVSYQQHNLGSLVLVLNRHIERFKDIQKKEMDEYFSVIKTIEQVLDKSFQVDKVNYYMLANNVSHFHFHIVPRYKTKRKFNGKVWEDKKWGHMSKLTYRKASKKDFLAIKEKILENIE